MARAHASGLLGSRGYLARCAQRYSAHVCLVGGSRCNSSWNRVRRCETEINGCGGCGARSETVSVWNGIHKRCFRPGMLSYGNEKRNTRKQRCAWDQSNGTIRSANRCCMLVTVFCLFSCCFVKRQAATLLSKQKAPSTLKNNGVNQFRNRQTHEYSSSTVLVRQEGNVLTPFNRCLYARVDYLKVVLKYFSIRRAEQRDDRKGQRGKKEQTKRLVSWVLIVIISLVRSVLCAAL